MSRVRVHSFSISLDGFGTGEGQSLDAPFGHAGHRLHEWMMATRFGRGAARPARRHRRGRPGHGRSVRAGHRRRDHGGEQVRPARLAGRPRLARLGGEDPPFHTPTYVLTHRPRPPLEMEGGTTFHFLDAEPAEALEVARAAAAGQDVRIGGGPTVLRSFLAADLVDHLHVVVVPILLGRGVRLWDGLEGLDERYDVEVVSTPAGVTHLTFTR